MDRAQIFPLAVFLVVSMEWLLGDEDVWSPVLEYRLKRAITFDLTVYSFRSDRWIMLKSLQGFPEAVFIGVAMEWLLGNENVCSVELEYRLKRAIPFGSTVGSRSNFSRSCFPWGSYGMATG